MKPVTLIILLFVLATTANGESPELKVKVRQDTVQDVELPNDGDNDDSITSRDDKDTDKQDSITKAYRLERKLEGKYSVVHSQISILYYS